MPDLTPTLREALTKVLGADDPLSADEFDALIALRDACPEPPPALEDGIYEVPTTGCHYNIRYVRDGRYSTWRKPDGTPCNGGTPLPADVSAWRRIDGPSIVTPEQFEEAARAAAHCSEETWATLSEELRVSYRDRARKVLTIAGIDAPRTWEGQA